MNEVLKRVNFSLIPVKVSANGNEYEITIQIPMDLGLIKNDNFILDDNVYQMEYFISEYDMAFLTQMYMY